MAGVHGSFKEELAHYAFAFPILEKLAERFAASTDLVGQKIGWHCHLTGLTAAAAQVLMGTGAKLFISECSESTSDPEAVTYMKQLGAAVYQGKDGPQKVLYNKPIIISDTGFVLNQANLEARKTGMNSVLAACEITTSGIEIMRAMKELPIPVININDGTLKTAIENYHGVGDGVLDALFQLTGRSWSGRAAAVVGYGAVGRGVADYLRRAGACVTVVEINPVRQLVAHYDGFALTDLKTALASSELAITCTGRKSIIAADEFAHAADRIVLMNVGHWNEEIDLAYLKTNAASRQPVAKNLEQFILSVDGTDDNRKRIYIVADGCPANVVMLTGTPEPTLIHLTTELLCMNYLIKNSSQETFLLSGENRIPDEVEQESSLLALAALGCTAKCVGKPLPEMFPFENKQRNMLTSKADS